LKKAIIDIDDTLWNFGDAWYEELKKIGIKTQNPKTWTTWSYGIEKGFLTIDILKETARNVHLKQHEQEIYESAAELAFFLKKHKYEIIIASHRCETTTQSTQKWLYKHDIYFDSVVLCNDKTVLLNGNGIVIDDMPKVLEKGIEQNMECFGLKFPYNEYISKANLFDNFTDLAKGVYAFVEK